MAATEHQRTDAVKRIEQGQAPAGPPLRGQRQQHQQRGKHDQQRSPHALAQPDGQRLVCALHRRRQDGFSAPQPPAHGTGQQHHAHLRPHTGPQQHGTGRQHHQRDPRPPHAQGARHAPHRLRHHSHRHDLQPMQRARIQHRSAAGQPQTQTSQQQRRGQREPQPRSQRAGQPGAQQAQRHTHLAAGRAGQKLAQGHQIGIAALGQPLAAQHKFGTEVAQVRHRATKRSQPQAQEYPEHLPGALVACFGGSGGHCRWTRSTHLQGSCHCTGTVLMSLSVQAVTVAVMRVPWPLRVLLTERTCSR